MNTSSVSQHIRALEAYLGVTLLHRTTRKLSLTEAGRIYYQECVKVVIAADQGREKVAALRDEPTGELRLAVSTFMSPSHLIPALKGFIQAYPDIGLNIEVNDDNIDLIERRIDLALRLGELQDARLMAYQVAHFDHVLCAAPDFLRALAPIDTPAALADLNYLIFMPTGDPALLDLTHASGETVRLRLNGHIKANHTESIRQLAIQGHGVARLLYDSVKDDIQYGLLEPILPDWSMPGVGAFIIAPSEDNLPLKAMRCIEYMRAHFDRIPHLSRFPRNASRGA